MWTNWVRKLIIVGLNEVLTALHIIPTLLAANSDAGFSGLMYNISQPLVALFQRIFPNAESQGSVLEVSSSCDILVYALLAVGIMHITGNRQTPRTTTMMPSCSASVALRADGFYACSRAA